MSMKENEKLKCTKRLKNDRMNISNRKVIILVLLCLLVIPLVVYFPIHPNPPTPSTPSTPREFLPTIKRLSSGPPQEQVSSPSWYGLSEEDLKIPSWDDLSKEDQDFLDMVQRAAFWYFWNNTNPKTGLGPGPNSPTVSSIAAVGFGLSAICIAESQRMDNL